MKTAADGWGWMKYLVLRSCFSNWKYVFCRYYTGWSVCCQYHALVPAYNMTASSKYIFIPYKVGLYHSSGSRLSASHHGSPGLNPGQVVRFVVDEMALGLVFSKYFVFPCQSHSTDCSTLIIIIYYPSLVQEAKYWGTYQVDSI
jgi:hypothetical protein